jgi:hypothetical protein
MKIRTHIAAGAVVVLLAETTAQACGTCALDSGGPGQVLMLVGMLSLPLVIAGIGYGVIRQILAKGEQL